MKKLLAALLALLLLTGCQEKKTQAEITLPEPEPSGAEETTPEPEPPVTVEMPTGRAAGGTAGTAEVAHAVGFHVRPHRN